MSEENNLKVLKASIKNFKNIDTKEIDIAGRSMIFAGPNQAGKSSLIQAICSPVNSKFIPVEPIKEGEEKGYAQITVGGRLDGEEVRYRIACHFSQQHKRGRLVLEDSDGAKIKGGEKALLNEIIGDISFDIMDFIRLGRTPNGKVSKDGVRQQIEVLKELMPKEDLKQIYALEHEKVEIYDKRTELNREVKYMKNQISEAGFSMEDIEKYSEKLDFTELNDLKDKMVKRNENINKSKQFVLNYDSNKENIDAEIEDLEMKLQSKLAEKQELSETLEKCNNYLQKNPEPADIQEIAQKLENMAEHNTKHYQVKELDNKSKQLKDKETEADAISVRLKGIDEEKKSIFANSKMPVKGLEFDDEKITFRGRPLSEDDIPTSQLIGVGLKVGMALNPNLRLLVIKDGSLLDSKTMEYVLNTCEKKGYQLLVETVKDTDDNSVEIEYIEK